MNQKEELRRLVYLLLEGKMTKKEFNEKSNIIIGQMEKPNIEKYLTYMKAYIKNRINSKEFSNGYVKMFLDEPGHFDKKEFIVLQSVFEYAENFPTYDEFDQKTSKVQRTTVEQLTNKVKEAIEFFENDYID